MAEYVLHQGASVLCAHGGQAQAVSFNPRVKVAGQSVVTLSDTHSISGCPFVTPAGSPNPCLSASWTTAATRVKAGGVPVLLKSSTAVCTPNGTGVQITATQTQVKAT